MNVYLQILTQNQTLDALWMVEWLGSLQPGLDSNGGRLVLASAGTVSRSRFAGIACAIVELRKRRFNELQVIYHCPGLPVFGIAAELKSLSGVFYPSASSALWLSTAEWPQGGDSSTRNRRLNAKARELALTHYNVSHAPTVFEVVLELSTSLGCDEVLDAVARWIVSCGPPMVRALEPFGCCDAGGPDYFVRFESNVLMTSGIRIMARVLPIAYPVLGERFDALHPLMFGTASTCSRIAKAIGTGAELHPAQRSTGVAAVRLSGECLGPQAAQRASQCILLAPVVAEGAEPGAPPNAGGA
jgi:hypothetical protein